MTIVYIFCNVVLPQSTHVFVDGNCGNRNTALSLPKVHLCSMAPWLHGRATWEGVGVERQGVRLMQMTPESIKTSIAGALWRDQA